MFSQLFGGSDAESQTSDGAASSGASQPATSTASDFFGSMLTNMREIGSKLKTELDTVVNVVNDRALGDFNREQQAFLMSKNRAQRETAVPPWVGYENADMLKEQILALSKDQRNFLRDPPPGSTQFVFDFEHYFPIAMATLQEDDRLQAMRFELVPKQVSEEHFWRNYFYRVSLIKQSSQLAAMSQSTAAEAAADGTGSDAILVGAPESEEEGGEDRPAAAGGSSNGTTDSDAALGGTSGEDGDVDDDADAVSEASFAETPGFDEAELHADLAELDERGQSKSDSNQEDSDGFTHIHNGPSKKKSAQPVSASPADADAAAGGDDGWDPELEKELEDLDLAGELGELGDLELGDGDWEQDLESMLDEA